MNTFSKFNLLLTPRNRICWRYHFAINIFNLLYQNTFPSSILLRLSLGFKLIYNWNTSIFKNTFSSSDRFYHNIHNFIWIVVGFLISLITLNLFECLLILFFDIIFTEGCRIGLITFNIFISLVLKSCISTDCHSTFSLLRKHNRTRFAIYFLQSAKIQGCLFINNIFRIAFFWGIYIFIFASKIFYLYLHGN